MEEIKNFSSQVIDNVEKVIVGKRDVVRMVLVSLLCEGHLLIEDVPGVGKTMLARAIAKSCGASFSRIQFTPDLLPSDVIGVNVFNQKTQDFEFKPGPIYSQIVLADEINRATPKAQSALLECMEERQVTVDGQTRMLPRPFMVIATQNPIEYEGTFPLPESELDRFFLRIKLGYPSEDAEKEILEMQRIRHPIEELKQAVSGDELIKMQRAVREVHIDESLKDYIVKLVQKTRQNSAFVLGASPRGSLALYRASQALAAMEGRDYVIPDDIKKMAIPALCHRIIGSLNGSRGLSVNAEKAVLEILDMLPVPR